MIVREGDAADRFYIIESGQVEGTRSAPDGDVHVLTMEAGGYFGEVGLLATDTRTPYLAVYDGAEGGQTAHYLLRWENTRGESGPWSETVSATIGA